MADQPLFVQNPSLVFRPDELVHPQLIEKGRMEIWKNSWDQGMIIYRLKSNGESYSQIQASLDKGSGGLPEKYRRINREVCMIWFLTTRWLIIRS